MAVAVAVDMVRSFIDFCRSCVVRKVFINGRSVEEIRLRSWLKVADPTFKTKLFASADWQYIHLHHRQEHDPAILATFIEDVQTKVQAQAQERHVQDPARAQRQMLRGGSAVLHDPRLLTLGTRFLTTKPSGELPRVSFPFAEFGSAPAPVSGRRLKTPLCAVGTDGFGAATA